MSATDAGDDPQDHVGSLGEEFAKLLGALSGCLGDHHQDGTDADGAGPDGADAGGTDTDGTSSECRFCPICRTAHAVREVSPEVKEHLRSAGVSLLHAASGLFAALTPDEPPAKEPGKRQRPDSGVEHIDLDDSDPSGTDSDDGEQ